MRQVWWLLTILQLLAGTMTFAAQAQEENASSTAPARAAVAASTKAPDTINSPYRYEKGVYATIPFEWDDAAKTLTIGSRKGDFPSMLKERIFKVVLVKEKHGNGIAATETPDQVVKYNGTALKVKVGE